MSAFIFILFVDFVLAIRAGPYIFSEFYASGSNIEHNLSNGEKPFFFEVIK